MHALKSTDHKRQSGFALVIALLLMAFVLMLILSMSLLVQVETTNASRGLDQLRAKEAARLALMMAIGDLQKHAGPDQRVTARAEILGDSVQNGQRYWTGVWDTENPGNQPVWLVSGLNTDPTAPSMESLNLLGASSVDITSTNYPEQYVSAPIIKVIGQNNETVQEIAWWISDEGVKASVGTLPLNSRQKPNFLDDAETAATELQIANTQGLEELFTNYDRFDHADAVTQSRISSSRDLLLQNSFLDEDGKLDLSGDEAPVHSLTTGSYGVLANTLPSSNPNSGLMRDLSLFPEMLGTGLADYLYLGETNEALLSGTGVDGLRFFGEIQGLKNFPVLVNGEVVLPIIPVLTNFLLGFTVRQNSKEDPNLYLRMLFFCELWNPYTHTLLTTNTDGNPLDLQLEITGLPDALRVEKKVYFKESDGSKTLVNSDSSLVDIQDILGNLSDTDNCLTIRLKNTNAEEWLPGRTKNWNGISNTNKNTKESPYDSTETTSKAWNVNARKLGGTIGVDTNIDISLHTESDTSHDVELRHFWDEVSDLEIKLYTYDPDSGTKELVASYGTIAYKPFETLHPTDEGFKYDHKNITFGYHVIRREPHYSSDYPGFYKGRWLYDHDPRNPTPVFATDWHLDNDPLNDSGSPYLPVIDGLSSLPSPTPESLNQFNSAINFISRDRLLDRSSPLDATWQDTPIFEIPRQRVLSLAALQHVYFHNERPFQIGNSWGSDGATNTSGWFDEYYFSGFSRNDDPDNFKDGTGLPNPSLIAYSPNIKDNLIDWQAEGESDRDAALQVAERVMVANRFNINSNSVLAWEAVIGSLRLKDWEYLDYDNDDSSDLSTLSSAITSRGSTFTRFSHSLPETYKVGASPSNWNSKPVAASSFYRHGARRLTSDQVNALSREIVRLIQVREVPFFNMAEFLSADTSGSSLLEQAIANTLTKNGRQQWFHDWELNGEKSALEDPSIDIDHFSPGFLTQADILTAIGPMLAPRSDTFKIRTSASTYNQQGDNTGSAALEAIVQRLPTVVNTGASSNINFGREFKLVSINWINADKL